MAPESIEDNKILALLALGFAATPIEKIPQTDLILPVLTSFTTDPSPRVRAQVVEILGITRNLSAAQPLVGLLDDKTVSERRSGTQVRESAIAALGQLDDPAALPALTTLFADSNKIVRVKAAAAVLQIVEGRKPVSLANELQSPVGISLTDFSLMSRMMLSMRRALPK
ncbi:HEAT repeat domain-containing protein [Candidatus Acetothermia bacterium]|nr:HEAT repeat domain-containing protein [Candidatus Acetothermia bacterium]MBI3660420.1 HEAT repeat domain-containing protein [Candidatus Acetothermia bacterium]